ncbi:molecular chaperone DnaK [Longispora fulva]|uniref:Molecular chaperone DnaK n=1 Tax=Longispora fulva TaxID=619741 RepID=A0A8J7KFM7_9ACTN|nr:Hsp70 family protein [Longispora fulva]MBG6133924.1 molecular chaperone DnaK [Longispora fulva]GIG62966.1 molecular chaperone DnaK [Longispora fulva]
MGRIIGIDLGTTFSAVAVVNNLDQPEVLLNRDGEAITPSVVLFQGDSPLVGTMAKRAATTAPLDVVEFVKRYMGDASWRFDTTEGRTFRAEEVAGMILKRLREDAEAALDEPVTDAVVTVPAYFDDAQRRSTQDAGTIAGLNVVRVLNEPTAAALAYGLATGFNGTALVYDLGGGTFDVTILRISGGDFDIVATGGDRNLGGFNWDNELMNLINARFVESGGEDLIDGGHLEALLRERAVLAKHSLTQVARTRVVLGTPAHTGTVEVTREDFERVTASLLSRTRELTEMVRDDAGMAWEQIDRVLLVGGSTRMPMVRRMVDTVIDRPVERRINPDEVVALGAAVQARLAEAERGTAPGLQINGSPVRIGDITSHGLGTLALNPDTGRQENNVLIPHNSKIPGYGTGVFHTIRDSQTQIDVEVTVGDDTDPNYVRIVNGGNPVRVTIPPYPAGAPVEIKYAYDIDQTVFIEVLDLTSRSSLGTFEVANVSNMSRADVLDAAQMMTATEVG